MNRALGHLCAHIGPTGPGEPPEDGEMIEMTLSSRHRIRNRTPDSGVKGSGANHYPRATALHKDKQQSLKSKQLPLSVFVVYILHFVYTFVEYTILTYKDKQQ